MAPVLFRSLNNYNFRVWSAAALVSNIGTWMQRIAQDWLVLTQLTDHDAAAVGLVSALQFGPTLFLMAWTGSAADRFDKRKLLLITQAMLGLLALGLGLLTVSGSVRIWQVDLFALMLGCTTAFDAPARQSFVSDMVGETDLPNALAINSTSFNASRMIGPAIAGVLIAKIGTGPVFLLNALSFVPVVAGLTMMRRTELHHGGRPKSKPGNLLEAFRYVRERPDLRTALLMLFLIGTFGLNFSIYISTMAVTAFHMNADGFGLLTSAMALGSVSGALIVARREKPDMPLLGISVAIFGGGCALAALMPTYLLFGMVLTICGLAAQTYTTSTNALVQISTEPHMRGRMMAILLTMFQGGQPVGALLVGWVANGFGPRWALAVGAASGLGAVLLYLGNWATKRA